VTQLTPQFPSQGWRQILTSRKEILDAYDTALALAKGHEVETFHGVAVEGKFRSWLEGFLPKRYGVTSGYVISPGLHGEDKTPHYDVIIYDRLNSPILWIEENSDRSAQGRSMAIPAEHVLGILEVKSSFSPRTVRAAIDHLRDLMPLMQGNNVPEEKFRLHLPPCFQCGCVFIEMRRANARGMAAMQTLLEGIELRGFFGGLILRGEGYTLPCSGELGFARPQEPMEAILPESLLSFGMSESREFAEGFHFVSTVSWFEINFARFAFDLIARLQGTYSARSISSFYGMGGTEPAQADPEVETK
jgi:hypothetical protein